VIEGEQTSSLSVRVALLTSIPGWLQIKILMPPHLHPRSRMTSSLFATTVVASFVVVALPHILPCPAPRSIYADGEMTIDENGKPRRRVRRETDDGKDESILVEKGFDQEAARRAMRRTKRECPVPKPGGLLGEWLGFHKPRSENDQTSRRVDR
jgi:cytochrome c oxidase assembly factor 2